MKMRRYNDLLKGGQRPAYRFAKLRNRTLRPFGSVLDVTLDLNAVRNI